MLKYEEIASNIEDDIINYNYPQGTKLPNINDLVVKYSVSKNTILKALNILEIKGKIYQVQGSGIFVRQQTRKGYLTLQQNKGFSNELNYLDVQSDLIEFELIKATNEVISALQCELNDEVYMIKRLQKVNNQVVCLEESYYLKNLVSFLTPDIVSGSIFQYIEQALNINIGFSDRYLTVHKTDNYLSQILQLPKASPMLLVEEIYYSTNGQAFNFTKNFYHYEHSQFFIQS